VVLVVLAFAEKTRWNQLEGYSFEKYLTEYNKEYSNDEYLFRKSIFETKLDSVRKHNQDKSQSWKKGINHMSDWTDVEFKRLLGYKKQLAYASKAKKTFTYPKVNVKDLPKHVDWRDRAVLTAVKDQGQCGSCWSLGTAETVESHWALATGELMALSQQQILDCTPNPNQCGGQGGCSGGTAELAYAQIMSMGGLTTEWTYPYVSYFGSNAQCKFVFNTTRPFAKISNYVDLPPNEYLPVLQAVATIGPLAISVDASAWSDYEHGVFTGCNKTNPDIDHEVQLVGYGSDAVQGDYWIVRNSWSAHWGDRGYILVARSETPQCGVDLNPADGTGCMNGPPQVTVCGACGILYDVNYPVI